MAIRCAGMPCEQRQVWPIWKAASEAGIYCEDDRWKNRTLWFTGEERCIMY